MRLYVNIYKYAQSDCTMNGVTSKTNDAILIWDESDEEINLNAPNARCVLILEKRFGGGYIAVPLNSKSGATFGGNFIYSCDSRFPQDTPIHVHDRYE